MKVKLPSPRPHACRYALNIGFNLLNKVRQSESTRMLCVLHLLNLLAATLQSIFKYYAYPWTVSTVHVIVGLVYCVAMYVLGFKDASFGRVRRDGAGCWPLA